MIGGGGHCMAPALTIVSQGTAQLVELGERQSGELHAGWAFVHTVRGGEKRRTYAVLAPRERPYALGPH